jgi:hypothetical protein
MIVEQYCMIEEALWQHGSQNKRSAASGLRHRYCLLHLTSGILRCESLYRAELSDFLGLLVPKKPTDPHDMWLMITQIPQGKTNHGRIIYGRAARHKDVLLCCIGGLSFYLAYRFWITGEFAGFTEEDWRQNDKWFDVKLLVDAYGNDFEKPMCNDSYGRVLKGILESLNLQSDKLLHLGRNLGSKLPDLMEEDCEAIRRMGNWNLGVFDTSYSSKIPLGPIRKLAGYLLAKVMFFNTRTTVEPSDQLLRLTPFGWAYDAFDSIVGNVGSNHTAFQVLKFFKELNRILVQDAAATLILHPERGTHAFFQMPFFKTVDFRVSTSVVGCCV